MRQAVLSRDSWRCRWCRTGNVELHHIRYRSQGGTHTVDNLIALCAEHHAKVHSEKRFYQPLLLEMLALDYYITFPVFLALRRARAAL